MGWFANMFLIAGLYFLSPRRRWPFLATFVGESIWAARTAGMGEWDMAAICAIFAALSLRNLIRWEANPDPGTTAHVLADRIGLGWVPENN